MRNYFLIIAILLVSVSSLFAVPAVPWAVEKEQPDGTKISVFLKGDERVNWMESADGYTLMYDSLKYVVYAQMDTQGNLVPSNIKFENNTPQMQISNANITSSGFVTVDYTMKVDAPICIELYSSSFGQKLKVLVPTQNRNAGSYSVQTSVSDLTPGTYIVKVTSGNQVESKQLIIK